MNKNHFTRSPRHALAGIFLCGAIAAAPLAPAKAAEGFRYSLATQQEFGRKRGFKLFFEDNTAEVPRKISTLRLVLGVADGKAWRFPTFAPQWEWNRLYKVRAVVGERGTEMWVDGQRVINSNGAFAPSDTLGEMKAGLDSRNMDGLSEYRVQQTTLVISTSRGQKFQGTFPDPEKWPLPLFLFEPQTPIVTPWRTVEGESLTIETSFRLLRADMSGLAPVVDRFGQARHADWPGKIRSEADLKAAIQDEAKRNEAWGMPTNVDAYGGRPTKNWSEKATGFFRVTRRDGLWWLVSPLGNPSFYTGVDTVTGTFEKTPTAGRETYFEGLPPRTGEFAPAWGGDGKSFGFTSANLIRRHGTNWEAASWKDAEARIRTWGFSGLGKWSGVPTPEKGPVQLPVQPVLRRTGVPTVGRMPDIFDPQIRAALRASLEKSIAPHLKNPFVLGWSLGNEHDEIVLKSDIQTMLKQPANVPARGALEEYALKTIYMGDATKMATAWKTGAGASAQPPVEDIETLRRHFADEYYGFVYRTVKEIDPNHLYFGFWILPGWWENEEDWRLIARHCDVIGYDAYRLDTAFADESLMRLIKEADKPILCGEFSYPSWYGGQRGLGVFGAATPDDATSGRLYAGWIASAARNPHCIGVHWFQYRDQPITGRGPSGPALAQGEHYAFGLVDITDRPKWDMIAPMRQANLGALDMRLQAAQIAAKK